MKYVYFIFLFLTAFACLEDADCLRTGDDTLVIDFKKLSDGKADTVFIYNIVGEGADSVFYKQMTTDKIDTIRTALLEVNPFADETLFTFNFESSSKTLRVGYKRQAQFISEDCGTEQVFYNLVILETQFDSVKIVNNRLSTTLQTNIEIIN